MRLLGVAAGLFTLGIFLASIPAYHTSVESICRVPVCPPGQPSVAQASLLQSVGISLPEYAALLVALAILSGACWCAVAVVLFLRGPGTFMALFASVTLVTFGLRRWIQIAIDRRFYRVKYDASQILEHFASGLQNEVELGTITDHLLCVIEETMQPVQISLWVRQSEPEERRASP